MSERGVSSQERTALVDLLCEGEISNQLSSVGVVTATRVKKGKSRGRI
jgi:hypothetical protein